MVPDVTAADGATLDTYEAIMLKIVERFCPEARFDHAQGNRGNRRPAANSIDFRLHNDLSEDGSPKPVVNRPAALALLFERIALQAPCIARNLHHSFGGEGI